MLELIIFQPTDFCKKSRFFFKPACTGDAIFKSNTVRHALFLIYYSPTFQLFMLIVIAKTIKCRVKNYKNPLFTFI